MKRWCRLTLAVPTIAAGVAACQPSLEVQLQGTNAPARLTLSLRADPPSLNTLISEDNVSYQILDHMSEGLLVFDLEHELAPGVAERWEFDPQTGATFRLRPDARWSDGTPVRAQDFVFAWREAVNPAIASPYAYIMYPLRNAEAINRGELPLEALGVSAPDDRSLHVEFEQPTPYFLSLVAFSTYRPVKESFYRSRGQRYASSAADLLYNGPFLIESWVHGARLKMLKNPHYWNRDAIALDEISYDYFTADSSATLNLFRDGKIALSSLEAHSVRTALRARFNIRVMPGGTVNFLSFNLAPGTKTSSLPLRRAIQHVVNAQELTSRIIGTPGVETSSSLFPAAMRRRFSDGHSLQGIPAADREQLAQWLDQARQQLTDQDLSTLTYLIPDAPLAGRVAEYLQQVFARELGIDLVIDRQPFKNLLARIREGDFEMAAGSWAPDYDDPLAYAELLMSRSADGRKVYDDPVLNAAYFRAATSSDQAVRNAALRELHRIMVEDALIVPYAVAGGGAYVQDPRLTGVRRSHIAGDPNFNYARLAN